MVPFCCGKLRISEIRLVESMDQFWGFFSEKIFKYIFSIPNLSSVGISKSNASYLFPQKLKQMQWAQ